MHLEVLRKDESCSLRTELGLHPTTCSILTACSLELLRTGPTDCRTSPSPCGIIQTGGGRNQNSQSGLHLTSLHSCPTQGNTPRPSLDLMIHPKELLHSPLRPLPGRDPCRLTHPSLDGGNRGVRKRKHVCECLSGLARKALRSQTCKQPRTG